MKKRIALRAIVIHILIGAFLLYATPLQQFIKLPALLAHYSEHKTSTPDITFTDFLFMHYIGDDGVPDDEQKDMELPFMKCERNLTAIYYFTPQTLELSFAKPVYTDIHYQSYTEDFLPSPHTQELFKPPQV